MNIFKITIATLIISQSAFASYEKAIIGGVIGGATASIVSNALKPSSENNKSSQGNSYRCWCGVSTMYVDYTDYEKNGVLFCRVLKNINGKKELKRTTLLRFRTDNAPEIIFGKLQQTNNLIGCEKI